MTPNKTERNLTGRGFIASPLQSFLWLVAAFLILLIVTAMCQQIVGATGISQRSQLLVGSALQGILAFIIPSLTVARIESPTPGKTIGFGIPSWKAVAGVAILYAISLPAFNQIVLWNAEMSLPDSMAALEKTLRQWEDNAEAATSVILDDPSWWGLVSGVLVVGVVTGIAEEMFFRGGIQRILSRTSIGPVASVWIAAFIFSAVHFQFFGFVPRLLLGAMFGYLYLWTRSIWVPAVAHAINNSMVVVASWLTARGAVEADLDNIGAASTGFPWMAVASAAITIVFLVKARRTLFSAKRPEKY